MYSVSLSEGGSLERRGGLTQEIELPVLKWEIINIDFDISLLRSGHQFDYVWFIVARMTKSANFLHLRTNYFDKDYAKLYNKNIMRLHGDLVSIISIHGSQFLSHFLRSLL